MSFRSALLKDQDTANAWEPVLKLCTTSMMSACLAIGLLGGVAGIALVFQAFNTSTADTDPLSIGDGIPIIMSMMLFSTFVPMAIALGVGKAILMKMEEDRQEQV